jgi:hypothetical protein
MSADPEALRQAEIKAHIAATRAELGETVEALAAKTQVKARAEDAARDALSGLKNRVLAVPLRLRAEAGQLVHRGSAVVRPVRRRLAVFAVLAGVLTALLTALRPLAWGRKR